MTRLKKALSVVAAASLMASALLIAPPFGSAADITGEDGYTWKVEADNPEGRVTGSAADGYTVTLDKEKQSAQLQVVFPNLLEQAFSLNTKISYFGGQLWTGIEFTSADGTLTKKLELVSEPGAGQPNQVIFYAEGTEVQERVNYAHIFQTDDTPRPVGLSFVQKNGHWYLKLTCASGMEIVLDGAGGKFNFDDFVGKGARITLLGRANATVVYTFTSQFLQNLNKTGEWKVTAPGKAPEVTGSAAEGYRFTLSSNASMAQFNYGFTDITKEELVYAPVLSKEFMEARTSNFTSVLSFSTNPDAAMNPAGQDDVIQIRPTYVAGSKNVHRVANMPSGPSPTLEAWGCGYFGIDDNFNPIYDPKKGGNVISFVNEPGIDGQNHWYLKIFVPRVGGWTAKIKASGTPTAEQLAQDAHLQFDRFVGKPVYVSFGADSSATSISYWMKSETAAKAAADNAAAIGEAGTAIDSLPETDALALTDKAALTAAAGKVDALGASRVFLKNAQLVKLAALESRMAELEIQKQVDDVQALIDAIPVTADELTAENYATYKQVIVDAQTAYSALGDLAARVDEAKAAKLAALSQKLSDLDAAYQANKQAAEAFDATVTALGKPEDITVANYTAKKAAAEAARAAYSALTPEVSALVNPLSLTALKAVEDRLPAVKKAVDADAAIKALPAADAVTLQNEEAIQAARAAYDALEADKSLIAAETLQRLTDAEARIPQLKADAAAALIGALPAPGAITLQDEAAVKAARAAYNALPDKALVAAETLKKLTDAEAKIAELKLDAAGDWYVNDDDKVKYTGSEAEGWQFEDCRGKGSLWATTTKDYDMTKDVITWAGATAGDSGWFTLSLTTDPNTGLYPAPGAKNGLFFILTPQAGNTLIVQCWTQVGDKMEAVTIASDDPASLENGKLTNFNLDGTHTYSFVKQDGHWYLKIDSHLFTGRAFDNFDAYMEANAAKTKVRIGGNNGFRTNGIQIANMEQSGDWWFSVLMGSATEGSAEDGYKLSVPAGAYAQYNLPIKNLENNPVYINFNANLEGKTNWAPEFAFVTGPNVDRKPTPGQGVAIRLVDKPEADPGNTHILAWAGTEWKTLTAVPACGGKDLTISVIEDGVQGHWYLQVAGKILSSSDPEIDKYLQMDNMVKGKDAYFRVTSASENGINPTVAFAEKKAEEPEETATDKFLALLNEHYDAASAGDKDALTLLAKAWNALDYFTQMDVEARLLDTDEGAYELLQIIKAYTVDDETSSGGNDDENSIPDTGSALPAAVLLLTALSAGTLLLLRKRK